MNEILYNNSSKNESAIDKLAKMRQFREKLDSINTALSNLDIDSVYHVNPHMVQKDSIDSSMVPVQLIKSVNRSKRK